MSELTAAEQMTIELLNRARLDPLGEAQRFGLGDLNNGLAPGTITAAPKQALAPNALLADAAAGHSAWMLAQDVFAHTGAGGSSPTERMQAAGYVLQAPWRTGENIAFSGTIGRLDPEAEILTHHEGLFLSAGHRKNILQADFREIGIGQEIGIFTTQGTTFNASMLTQNFARSGSAVFVTGVVYDDTDGDGFYSIGEGRGGLAIAAGGQGTVAQSAGGYALALAPGGMTEVTLGSGAGAITVAVDLSAGNAKLDLVDGVRIMASADLELRGGVTEAGLLGTGDLSLAGTGAGERLTGNAGANMLAGGAGFDTLDAGAGNDTVLGGNGRDRVLLGDGNDLFTDNGQGGGLGRDTVFGGAGGDTIQGGNGGDDFFGVAGNDLIFGRLGNDRLFGGDSFDTLHGGDGDDTVDAGQGRDRVFLGNGADLFIDHAQGGGLGRDTVSGGAGDDTIRAGGGDDLFAGGAGADVFVFAAGMASDRITDFELGLDRLEFAAGLLGAAATGADAVAAFASLTAEGVLLDFGAGDGLLLAGLATTAGLADDIAIA